MIEFDLCVCDIRALCYLSVKQYRDAVRDCDEALMIDSSNIKALYRRAQAHKELKVRGWSRSLHFCFWFPRRSNQAYVSSVCLEDCRAVDKIKAFPNCWCIPPPGHLSSSVFKTHTHHTPQSSVHLHLSTLCFGGWNSVDNVTATISWINLTQHKYCQSTTFNRHRWLNSAICSAHFNIHPYLDSGSGKSPHNDLKAGVHWTRCTV